MTTPHPPRPRGGRRTVTPPLGALRRAPSSQDAPDDERSTRFDVQADAGTADERETRVSRADAETLQRALRTTDAVPLLTREEEVAIAEIMATGTQRVRDLVLPLPVTVRTVLAIMQEAPAEAARQLFENDEDVPPQELSQRLAKVAARVPVLRLLARQSRALMPPSRARHEEAQRAHRHRMLTALADLGLADRLCAAVVHQLRLQMDTLGVHTRARSFATRRHAVEAELGMTVEEVRTILERITQAQHEAAAARHCLIEANMRLVPRLARRYVGRGLELLDLIQEGSLGLTRAVDKFDARRGYLLATYASWWIKSAMLRALDKANVVSLPRRLVELKPTVTRASVLLVHELGREPTPRELAQFLHLPVETIADVLRATGQIVSLATPIGESEVLTLGDVLADPDTPSPAAVVEARESFALASQAVQTLLTPAEVRALRHRLGLPPMTSSDEATAMPDPAARGRLSRKATQALRTLRTTLGTETREDDRRHKK